MTILKQSTVNQNNTNQTEELTVVKDSVVVRRNLNQCQFLFSNIGNSIFSPVERKRTVKSTVETLGKT